MKLNDKKFGKIIAEPNLPQSAEPRTEPKFRSLPSVYRVEMRWCSQNIRPYHLQHHNEASYNRLSTPAHICDFSDRGHQWRSI